MPPPASPRAAATALQPTPEATHAVVVGIQYHGPDALARIKLDQGAGDVLPRRIPGDPAAAPATRVWVGSRAS